MKKLLALITLLPIAFLTIGCNKQTKQYFALWNECDALTTLKNYVEDVTNVLFFAFGLLFSTSVFIGKLP